MVEVCVLGAQHCRVTVHCDGAAHPAFPRGLEASGRRSLLRVAGSG